MELCRRVCLREAASASEKPDWHSRHAAWPAPLLRLPAAATLRQSAAAPASNDAAASRLPLQHCLLLPCFASSQAAISFCEINHSTEDGIHRTQKRGWSRLSQFHRAVEVSAKWRHT